MYFKIQDKILFQHTETELDQVPEWARAEHLERVVPLKELWDYPRAYESKTKIRQPLDYGPFLHRWEK